MPAVQHLVAFRAWSDPRFPGLMTSELPFTIGTLVSIEQAPERGPR
jgi:hypothetical protein